MGRLNLSLLTGTTNSAPSAASTSRTYASNGQHIHDKMPGKPGWYKTSDFARIFIGEHAENVTFE